ncbi:CaiB/BaiF CoA transferase family protein [Yinghuangia seranimata]|uniref:CaiB/BaiF CoA transferase family protein n=1 Tax=Yinghuangia seranimata TaxID=408067 RepID=UPI00248C9D93|nr:CoA transferase [Yinghuangia seranimata]MDI2132453.1 CoA transferase [Yinghuangia seranimata]
MGTARRPLEDVRIIAVEQYGAGPWGSLHLADLGAEVIKIEDPGADGDVGRYVPPYADGEDSLFFEVFNRNKRSLSLDLASASGRAVFEELVRVSDVVYSNLRGDVPAKIGITYADLKHLNPRIVCCSLSGFGMSGPRVKEPGYDYILQGLLGWMDVTGEPDGPPTKSGLSMVDYSAGFIAAISLLAGVHAARRDGIGMDCDVSLFDTALALLNYPAAWHLNAGYEPQRTRHSSHPSLVPFQLFETADKWIVVGCPKEKFWHRLTEVVGHPEWAADPRFATFADRERNREALLALLEPLFRTRPAARWLADLYAVGVPCGPVNSVAEALADPHTDARDMVVETDHPRYGRLRLPATAVRVGDLPRPDRRAPRRNEDFGYVLCEVAGFTDDRVAELVRNGAFGSTDTVPGIPDRYREAAE